MEGEMREQLRRGTGYGGCAVCYRQTTRQTLTEERERVTFLRGSRLPVLLLLPSRQTGVSFPHPLLLLLPSSSSSLLLLLMLLHRIYIASDH